MSISGIIFTSIVVIKILWSFFDGLDNGDKSIHEETKISKKPKLKFISNGIELNETIRRHYYKVLDIHSSPIINNDVVFEKYLKHLHFLKEEQLLGYKLKYSISELKAAHYYLDDLCEYFGNLN
jgi:hypothetical protein